MTTIQFPKPGQQRPPFETAIGVRTTYDLKGDGRDDREANIRYAPSGELAYDSNGHDRHLADDPSPAARAAVQRYVDAFERNDDALRALGSVPKRDHGFFGLKKGHYEVFLFRQEQSGETRQILRGRLDSAPAPIRDLVTAAQALQPHLQTSL